MKKSIYIPILLVIVGTALVWFYQRTKEIPTPNSQTMTDPSPTPIITQPQASVTPETETSNTFTLEEVAVHDNKEDCWLVINDKVYEVTSFIAKHPGGEAILQGCGKDATVLFKTRPMGSDTEHSEKAYKFLETLYLGDLEPS